MGLAATTRKLEILRAADEPAVATLSKTLLRVFVRLQEVEAAMARLGRRLAALEGPQPVPTATATPATPTPERRGISPFGGIETLPASNRPRGRPRTSPTRSRRRTDIWTHREDLESWYE
jgi:hypothetical protein